MMLLLSRWLEAAPHHPFFCFLFLVVHPTVKDALSDLPYPDVRLARSHLHLMGNLVDITLSVLAHFTLHFSCRYIVDSVTSHIMAYY